MRHPTPLLVIGTILLLGAGCPCPTRTCATTAPRAGSSGTTTGVPAVGPRAGGVTSRTLPFVAGRAIALPKPRTTGGLGLFDALQQRRSSRSYDPRPLPLSVLSDLLWATTGVNRQSSGKRTAPTARDRRDAMVYVATEAGLYLYDPVTHALVPKLRKDLRAQTGKQAFVGQAPVNLVFVSDFRKVAGADDEARWRYAGSHAGFMSQNVYLFCAAVGLATVVRGYYDGPALTRALALPETQRIVLTQTVGYEGSAPR